MKALVVYDSVYGNTKAIAEAIGVALDPGYKVEVLHLNEAGSGWWQGLSVLVVGSPTQIATLTKDMNKFLKQIPGRGLAGVKVAAFDTRLTIEEIEEHPVLPTFVKIFGYAAKPVARRLKRKGGEVVVAPEGFLVVGNEGPLVEGELERAAAWGRQIGES